MRSSQGYSKRMRRSAQNKSAKLALLEDQQQQVDSCCLSDCESGISRPEIEQQRPGSSNGLVRISEGEIIHETIKKKLVSILSSYGVNARVEAVHRNGYSGIMSQAKHQAFGIFSRAMEIKCGGNANVKYAWYGAPKSEIDRVLAHGFGLPMNNGVYGQGVYLSPVDHPVGSLQSSVADADGITHMLLCRVILGKAEAICPGSGQCNPSCEEFDSGVDNLESPRKYIIWSSRMNTHILPGFVVSFRGVQKVSQPPRLPNSDWMPFPSLISVLSKYLPPDAIELIAKHYNDHKRQKITRHEMVQHVRHIAGDDLLTLIIKSYRGKIRPSWGNGSSGTQVHSNRRN